MSCSKSTTVTEEPDALPKLTIDPLTTIEGNQTKSVFVSFRLNMTSQQTVNVTVSTEDISTTAGEDYTGITSQEFSFAPGSVQENLKIEILGDEDFEENETFKLKINSVQGATAQTQEIEIVIENDDLFTDYNIPTAGYETPTSYDGMTLFWNDEFEGDGLNEDDWTFEIGNGSSGWGNNELEYYRKENTSTFEGNLVIQAREENFGGFGYTSSRIITKDKLEFTYGRVDIRAVIPEGQGIWPALWMLGANISEVSWPRCGEIDIMELVGHEPSTVHGTVHYPDQAGNHQFIGSKTSLNGGEKFSQSFHVFSIVWEENSIKWYLDDRLYYSITPETLGTQNPYPFDKPQFFIFNVAVGGNWPGSPDATTKFPQNMFVDYIRVFQNN